tara:strand:+ start:1523 stop:1894 length:372 start_codon:yes stop_codon:yes gene_type:complete
MTNALQNLPPEMQERLAQIMAGQQPAGNAPAAPTPPAPVAAQAPMVKPPSLMDHIIALRQEVAQLKQQVDANSNVVDAVGQAVGTLYQMFQPSAQSNASGAQVSPGPTYSDAFSQSVDQESDY